MTARKLAWTAEGWDDYLYWQSQDRRILKRINTIIVDILRGGYDVANPNRRILPPRAAWEDSWDVGVFLSWSLTDGGRTAAPQASVLSRHRECADVGGGFRKFDGELIGVAELDIL